MKKLFVLILALMLVAAPIVAQTDEPVVEPVVTVEVTTVPDVEVPPVVVVPDDSIVIVDQTQNPGLLIALSIMTVATVVFGSVIVAFALQFKNMMPRWMIELLIQNRTFVEGKLDEAFDLIDHEVDLTPNEIDDVLASFGRTTIISWLNRFYSDDPEAQSATANATLEPTSQV